MLPINEIFTSIQGEGSKAGLVMFFIRLQGCSVGCHFCDTKYTWKFEKDDMWELVDLVKSAKESYADWVCITGGEPAEHDIEPLIIMLQNEGFKVMVETSGYGGFDISLADWVVLSPKDRFTKKMCDLTEFDELKCVVTDKDDAHYYAMKYRRFKGVKAFQPVNNDGKIASMLIKLNIPNWRITGQQHVLFGLQ